MQILQILIKHYTSDKKQLCSNIAAIIINLPKTPLLVGFLPTLKSGLGLVWMFQRGNKIRKKVSFLIFIAFGPAAVNNWPIYRANFF